MTTVTITGDKNIVRQYDYPDDDMTPTVAAKSALTEARRALDLPRGRLLAVRVDGQLILTYAPATGAIYAPGARLPR